LWCGNRGLSAKVGEARMRERSKARRGEGGRIVESDRCFVDNEDSKRCRIRKGLVETNRRWSRGYHLLRCAERCGETEED